MVEYLPDTNVGNIKYIDRQVALDIVRHECGEWKGLAEEIVKQFTGIPAADVVPVVRCKNCQHWEHGLVTIDCYWDADESPGEMDFCSRGKRKE